MTPKRLLRSVFLFGALAFLGYGIAEAQTYGGTGILKIKPGGRASAMGQAGVAVSQRAHSVWWNPALLGVASEKELSSTFAQLVPDLADDVYYLNFAGVYPVTDAALAVDVMYLTYGSTLATKESGDTVGSFNSYEFAPVLGVGLKVAGVPFGEGGQELGIYAGLAAKYVWVDLVPGWVLDELDFGEHAADGAQADAVGLDVGFLGRIEDLVPGTVEALSVGANVQNLGTELSYISGGASDPLPRNLKAGVALELFDGDPARVTLAFDYNKSLTKWDVGTTSPPDSASQEDVRRFKTAFKFGWSSYKPLLNAGMEVSVAQDLLNLRLGYIHDPEGEITAFTFGGGLNVSLGSTLLRFDYSSIPQAKGLDRVSYISVGAVLL